MGIGIIFCSLSSWAVQRFKYRTEMHLTTQTPGKYLKFVYFSVSLIVLVYYSLNYPSSNFLMCDNVQVNALQVLQHDLSLNNCPIITLVHGCIFAWFFFPLTQVSLATSSHIFYTYYSSNHPLQHTEASIKALQWSIVFCSEFCDIRS